MSQQGVDMASIRQRTGRWNVQVRRKNYPLLSKTFTSKESARYWGRKMERLVDQKKLNITNYPTLKEIIKRYIREVSIHKLGYLIEIEHLKAILQTKIINKPVDTITPQDLSDYRNKRLLKVRTSTIIRELNIIQHIFNVVNNEWGLQLTNPCKYVSKPKVNNKRERRLSADEYNFLLKNNSINQTLNNIIEIALETGMRRGEILNIHSEHIKGQTLLIPVTKNGHARTIPLTSRALCVLENSKLPFSMSANAVRLAWDRLKKKGNIQDLHFHDLRHEAISCFFEKGLSIPEVALISGHKDVRMLFRYTHLRAEDIVNKL